MPDNVTKLKSILLATTLGGAFLIVLLSSLFGALRARQLREGLWTAEFFTTVAFEGPPALTRADETVFFNWDTERPFEGFQSDGYSARWTRTAAFDEGIYLFAVESDDGARLSVDGQLMVDNWLEGETSSFALVAMSEGSHDVTVEYYEEEGRAVLKAGYVSLETLLAPSTERPWQAEFYPNRDLTGPHASTRQDAAIDFDWGSESPTSDIAADDFSARWTRTDEFEGGVYLFAVGSDDGARVYLDGRPIIDVWQPRLFRWTVTLLRVPQGEHEVIVEYFELDSQATIQAGYAPVE